MKVKQKPLSFSLCEENIAYVEEEYGTRHRNRSHWMDDLLTHLRLKKEATATQVVVVKKPKAPKIKRKTVSYPSNLDDQFLLLWDTKGKKGQKQKAYDIFRKMSADVTDEICEQAKLLMIDDLHKNKHEAGYPERHLTSYLNGKFWEE